MRRTFSRNPDLIMVLIAGYFLLAIAVRVIRSPALEVDETQQALFSQFLLLGYGSQPPLYNWLQHGMSSLFGMSIATLSLLKNALLFLSCLFFWLAARQVIRDRSLSIMATLGMLTAPAIFLMSQRDLSHTVIAVCMASLFLFAFFRTLERPHLTGYVLTGAAIALGALSKYNFVILPLAALMAVLPEKDLRSRLLDWRMVAMVAVCALIALPHGLWILENFGLATSQTLQEMNEGPKSASLLAFEGSMDMLVECLRSAAIACAIFALLFYRDVRAIIAASDRWTRIVGRMFLISLVLVLLIVICLGVTNMRQKWLAIYFLLLPLYLCLKIQAAGVDVKPKLPPMVAITATLTVGFLLILLVRGLINPLLGHYSLIHIPYDRFAETVRREGHPEPQYVIASGGLVGGNLKIQFPDATVFSGNPDIETLPSPWPEGATILFAGTDIDGLLPENPGTFLSMEAARTFLPAPAEIRHLELPYSGKGDKRHAFYYAWETTGPK